MPEIIITSSLLIGLLILMRRLFRNRISCRLQYALWLLPAIRLLLPVSLFENPFNIMNVLLPATRQIEDWSEGTFLPAAKAPEIQAQMQEKTSDSTAPSPENADAITAAGSGTPGCKDFFPSPGIISGNQLAETMKSPHSVSPGQFLHYIWYTGMAVMVVWMAGGCLLNRRRLSRRCVFLGREGKVKIYIAKSAATPCLLGLLHPVIYLTPSSIQTEQHREHTLLHELTHYRHGDHIWIAVRNLCLVVYWFHPLVWLGASLAARDCELACDEGVLRRLGAERAQAYGRTLIEMAASFRKTRLPYYGAALSSGKRELKERISRIASGKGRTSIPSSFLAAACASLLISCTFGGAANAQITGRYMESAIELTGTASAKHFYGITREGNTIRLISNAGFDVISRDGGATFENGNQEDMPPGTMALYERYPISRAGSINGAQAFRIYDDANGTQVGTFHDFLITETGEEVQLHFPADSHIWYFYDNGSFFIEEITDSANRYYLLNPSTGEKRLLTENGWTASCMAADEDLLYLVNENGVLLWGLHEEETVPQDPALSDFVAEHAAVSPLSGEYPALLHPYGNGVYILTHSGLYWHELYTKTTELVIDGSSCTMGNTAKELTGMTVIDTEAEPAFLILYDNKELFRYTCDASLP